MGKTEEPAKRNGMRTCTVKEISLTQGKVAIVDEEDYESISKFKWHACKSNNGVWYARRYVLTTMNPDGKRNCKHISMHSMLINSVDGLVIDHIDGDGLNNCRSNLRLVTTRGNCINRHYKKSSLYPGVTFTKVGKYHLRKPWLSQITVGGKNIYLGRFSTEAEAHHAYISKCNELGLSTVGAI